MSKLLWQSSKLLEKVLGTARLSSREAGVSMERKFIILIGRSTNTSEVREADMLARTMYSTSRSRPRIMERDSA